VIGDLSPPLRRRRVIGGLAAAVLVLGAVTVVVVWAGPTGGLPAEDYVAIQDVPAASATPVPAGPGGSAGSFTSDCGRNENGHINEDNFVATPGVPGGAHHTHEYVGNLSTNAYSTEQSLVAAATTCTNGDPSSYYWPVLRLLVGHGHDAHPPGHAGSAGNTGQIQRPASVRVQFTGSSVGPVVPMPRFLRLGVGDPFAFTDGGRNTRAQWGCEGFPGRTTSRYPLCPAGGRVTRTFDFPSCWDGLRTDSPDHHSHVRFPADTGACPPATFPIPHLRIVLAYQLPPGPGYAIDSFPEQRRSPLTDHGFLVNLMPDRLMASATDCINQGQDC
jgi:Domain of unknown function (DUF1996)